MLTVFTIGHITRTWKAFPELLRKNGVKRVIEVCSIPGLTCSLHLYVSGEITSLILPNQRRTVEPMKRPGSINTNHRSLGIWRFTCALISQGVSLS